jgi:hypothetical protein
MDDMDWIALIARLLLSAVFLVAAVGKLADRQGSREVIADFGVPKVLAAPVALVLPFVELAISFLLVPDATSRWGAAAALGMLLLFIAGMAISLARGRQPDCHCFGQLSSAPVGRSTLLRNGALAGVAALVLWYGGRSPEIASISATVGSNAAGWVALVVALVALALAAIEAWFILNLLTQQGRLLLRVDALEVATGLERLPDFRSVRSLPTSLCGAWRASGESWRRCALRTDRRCCSSRIHTAGHATISFLKSRAGSASSLTGSMSL